jgi:hypothetical protein
VVGCGLNNNNNNNIKTHHKLRKFHHHLTANKRSTDEKSAVALWRGVKRLLVVAFCSVVELNWQQ